MEFVTFEMAKKLKEKGFKEKCLFAYNDEQIINPKVVEEYGYLSDDGYYELTEDGGGKLKWDYVYIYEKQIILRNKIIIKRNFIDAPTISQALKWLREEKKIYLEIVIVVDAEYMCDIYKISPRPIECLGSTEYFKTYEEASIAGIEYVLDNLI